MTTDNSSNDISNLIKFTGALGQVMNHAGKRH